jgi:hypothetical protein
MEEIAVVEGLSEEWRIRRDGDQLTFRSESGAHFEIGLDQTAGRVEWSGLVEDSPHFVVLAPVRRVFRMEQSVAFTLLQWLGAPGPDHLKAALRKRLPWTLLAGLVWVGTSFVPNGAADSLRLDPVAIFLGSVLLFEALLVRFKPMPAVFLVDAAWCVCAALLSIYDVFDRSSLLGALFAPFLIRLSWLDVQQYSHFQWAVPGGGDDSIPRSRP